MVSKYLPAGESSPIEHMRKCGARCRDGTPCEGVAIRGGQRCRMHGGAAPAVRDAATRRSEEVAVERAVHKYGKPRRTTPVQALEEELDRTQGHVDWLAEQVGRYPEEPVWRSVYQAERDHLTKLAAHMVTAKTAERRLALGNRTAALVGDLIDAVLRDFGLDTTDDAVRRVIRRHLDAMQGKSTDPAAQVEDAEVVGTEDTQPVEF
ncbi:HGGxSTG domain-containing protein [Actinomycetospora atypica]|uniref:HGGxSTG domain-containing protein n=1 Tax=Actinomycetospora atypica TaxID=1290095 RepID=A0ABV9YTQ9_9PSEU